ncbi:hypothetical protein MTO96_031090 [Rhipicephalus appendiculatus]
MRMVHDYRELKAKTVNPPDTTPLMEDDLDHIMTKICTPGSRSSPLDSFNEGPSVVELLGSNTLKIARNENRHRRKKRVVNVEQLRRHTVRNPSFSELGKSFVGQQLRQRSKDASGNQKIKSPQENLGVQNKCGI